MFEHHSSHEDIIALHRLRLLKIELKAEGLMAKCHA